MTHRLGIFVFDGVTLLDASGPAEVFRLADPDYSFYELVFISPSGGSIRCSSGMELAGTEPASDQLELDTLLVTGGEALTLPQIDSSVLDAVRYLADTPKRVASVCTGAFILAELGLLDGRNATTHWRHVAKLKRRYPSVSIEADVIHIQDGRYMTSAGITAGIDLALAIVEQDLGVKTARRVAQELVVFMQRPGGQTQFSAALDYPVVENDRLRNVLDAVLADPAEPHTVRSMAAMVGVSDRHLNRMFRAEIGSTPAQWLEKVRTDLARNLLLEGRPITHIAQLSGFGNDETLRRAFARQLDTTPSAFRARFSTTAN